MKRTMLIIVTICWMAAIFWFSAQPAGESAQISLSAGKRVGHILVPAYDTWSDRKQEAFAKKIDYPVRKCAHATEYAVLGGLLLLVWWDVDKEKMRRKAGKAFLIGVCYAATDEFHQLFVPGRSGQVTDVLIDGAGVAVGVFLLYIVLHLCKRHKRI